MHHGKHSRLSLALIALVLASGACSSRDDGAGAPAFVASADAGGLPADIGTGFADFTNVIEGDEVDVVAGPQGGFHVWTAVRVSDVTVDTAQVGLSARFAESGELAGKPSRIMVELQTKSGMRERAGMTNFINDPAAVRGQRIILRAEVVTSDGRAATKECTVVPR